jgi:succinate-semialdehyde dehydrogenase/glutarate-semialdehyde dehydrogenase
MTIAPPQIDTGIRASIELPPTDLLIGNEWRPAESGERFDVIDPVTEQVIASVARGREADVQRAVAAARAAVDGGEWSKLSGLDRAKLLFRLADLMERDFNAMTLVETLDIGQPLKNPATAIATLRYYAGWADKIDGRYVSLPDSAGRPSHTYVRREPIGVVAAITPWNSPLMTGAWKVAPALAAGCSVVLKPASETPLTALAIGDIMQRAGAPAGVVNVVVAAPTGPRVSEMLHDPRVVNLSFTGSTEVGVVLLREAADQVVRTSMELGGNAPFLVLEGADIDAAVEGAMVAKLRNGGAACTAANRFFVHRSLSAEFTRRLGAAMASLRMGPGLVDGVDIASLVSVSERDKVAELVERAVGDGARPVVGGRVLAGEGAFYPPTVLDRVSPENAVLGQEIFGPVAPVVTVDSDEEAIQRANDTPYGLISYVYAGDLRRGLRACGAMESGMVALNRGVLSDPAAPFGGYKQSGLGREGGFAGIHEFLETKYIALDV